MNIVSALILTILIEFVIYAIFIRKDYLLLLGYSLLINSITNPTMNIALSFSLNLIILEFIVFLVEIFLIKHLMKTKYQFAVLLSFVANLISLLIGLIFA